MQASGGGKGRRGSGGLAGTSLPLLLTSRSQQNTTCGVYGSCRDVNHYEKLNRIGQGTYGTVYRGREKVTGEIVALKKVILHNEHKDGFPATSVREVRLLQRLAHVNIVRLIEVRKSS